MTINNLNMGLAIVKNRRQRPRIITMHSFQYVSNFPSTIFLQQFISKT